MIFSRENQPQENTAEPESDSNRKIISLVTPIIDSANGKVGVIESAMTMENMFPSLYEGIEDEWSFFYSDEGVTYFGQKEQTESSALLDDILKQRPTEDKIQTIHLLLSQGAPETVHQSVVQRAYLQIIQFGHSGGHHRTDIRILRYMQ